MKSMRRVFVAEMSEAEMACRIAESVLGVVRPEGASAEEVMDCLHDDSRETWLNAAKVAFAYFKECIEKAPQSGAVN